MFQNADKVNECGKKFQYNFFPSKAILSGKTQNEFGCQQKTYMYIRKTYIQYF